jgi:hypothetical protein
MKKTLAIIVACIAGGYTGFLIGFTQVTDEGTQKLQQALPDCRIEH